MKAILMSIRPQHTCNILNDIKWWEIRKKFPKDYVGWVYIYCTKDRKDKLRYSMDTKETPTEKQNWKAIHFERRFYISDRKYNLNGKVVARFWCDKVEDYVYGHKWSWEQGAPMWGADNSYENILKDACLTEDELYDYCEDLSFKAIHITKLEIFDKPKEISEFYGTKQYFVGCDNAIDNTPRYAQLHRAPQSYMFIEV